MGEVLATMIADITQQGLSVSPEQEARLAELAALQADRAPVLGLSKYDTETQVLAQAISPITSVLRLAPPHSHSWAEVGAGAGALGLALAILLPKAHVTLFDRRKRSTVFIDMLTHRISADNCCVVQADLPDDAAAVGGKFKVVLARAVAPPNCAAAICRSICEPNGQIILLHHADDVSRDGPAAGLARITSIPTAVAGLVATAYQCNC